MTEGIIEAVASLVACVGCGGLVAPVEGPVHRYMTASPGCWRAYTELLAGGLPPSPAAGLTVDAYAVTHPGVPGPQSTPSVWIHLLTLCFVLERRWPVERAIHLRRVGADAFDGWPWLTPPESMGPVTAIDIDAAIRARDGSSAVSLTRRWVDGAWAAWFDHHPAVRSRAEMLGNRLG